MCCLMPEATLQNTISVYSPYHYSRESDNLYYALPVGYLRPSQNTTLSLYDKKKLKKLASKEYEQMCTRGYMQLSFI